MELLGALQSLKDYLLFVGNGIPSEYVTFIWTMFQIQ